MLKFTYSETGIALEHLSQSAEYLVSQRAVLAVRTQSCIAVEPCSASFLLPADLDQLQELQRLVAQTAEAIALSIADADYVEVSVHGVWLCEDPDSIEGVFVVSLSPSLETLITELWQISQFCFSVASG